MKPIELEVLLNMTQQYISTHYASSLIDRTKNNELKSYIAKYLYDTGYVVEGYDRETLIRRLFLEMSAYSILSPYLSDPDIEEININGWDDVALTHLDGKIEKLKESFFFTTACD